LYAGVKKLDFEGSVAYGAVLTNQLIKPLSIDNAAAISVNVGAVVIARRPAINRHPEVSRLAIDGGTKNEMQVPRMEAINDLAVI
jgi:hypothetical protein